MKNLCLLLILLLLACNKGGDTPTPVTPPVGTVDFSVSKTELFPLELLTITLASPTAQASFKVKIGTNEVVASQVVGNQYSLLIPETLKEGNYVLSLPDGKKTVGLIIKKPNVIANPTQYNQDFVKQTNELIGVMKSTQDSLVKYGLSTSTEGNASLATINASIADFQKRLGTASPAEIKTTAAFLDANRVKIDSLFQFVQDLKKENLRNGRIGKVESWDQDFDLYLHSFGDKLYTVGPKIAYFFTAIAVAIAGGNVLVAVGVAVLANLAMESFNLLYKQFGSLRKIYDSGYGGLKTTVEVVSNLKRRISAKLSLRNIDVIEDIKSTVLLLKSIASNIKYFRNQFLLPSINEYVTIKPIDIPVQAEDVPVRDADKLSVTVNNANVKATISNFQNGAFDLIFTTAQSAAQAFDYTITYFYGGVAVSETITGNTLTAATTTALSLSTSKGVPFTAAGEADIQYLYAVGGYPPKASTTYRWNYGDGSSISEIKGANDDIHTYSKPGTYTITVNVTEGITTIGQISRVASITSKGTFTISTPDGAPITKAGEANKSYTFALNGTNWQPNSKSIIIWTFGDNTNQEEVLGSASVKHSYAKEGIFDVKARLYPEDGSVEERVAQAKAFIGSQAEGDFYITYAFGENSLVFPSEGVSASIKGGRFDIVGNYQKLQTGIFFAPVSKFTGVGTYNFIHNCDPALADSYAIGAHLYSFATLAAIATTYSKAAVWGCAPNDKAVSSANGQVTVTKYDGKVIEGTFYYTDVITGLPVLNGKFRAPIK